MKQILITGSSRGIGFEFVRQFLNAGNRVIACNRNPDKYPDLLELKEKYKENLILIDLDVSSKISIINAYDTLSKEIDRLDILINNAGIRFGGDEKHCDKIGLLFKEDFSRIFAVNTIGPILLIEKFLPLIKNGTNPIIVNISSTSGSIGRRYARADEIGIPFCVTIDFDSIEKKDVTVRNRDDTKQIRVKISELKEVLGKLINSEIEYIICRTAVLYGWNQQKHNYITCIITSRSTKFENASKSACINSSFC